VPPDFALDVSVWCGADVPERPEAHLRPGRFIMFADGSLHYGVDVISRDARARGEDHGGLDWRPGRTRDVRHQDLVDLWALVERLGYGDPEGGTAPINPRLLDPPDAETIRYVITCVARRHRRMFVQDAGAALTHDPVALVRRLAALAWVTDQPMSNTYIAPIRYDFGPDPYERFREGATK